MSSHDKTWNHRGRLLTTQEACELFEIPRHVFEWRLKRGNTNMLFQPIGKRIEYAGKIYSLDMLADLFCLGTDIIRRRWDMGIRGDDLVATTYQTGARFDEGVRRKMKAECQNEWEALREHHRTLMRESLIQAHKAQQARRSCADGYDYAAARQYAKRLEDAVSPAIAAQNSITWEGEAA